MPYNKNFRKFPTVIKILPLVASGVSDTKTDMPTDRRSQNNFYFSLIVDLISFSSLDGVYIAIGLFEIWI
jgi:hypothetical protein